MSEIKELQQRLESKELSCTELTKEHLTQAAKEKDDFNSYITITEEAALAQAAAIDEKIRSGASLTGIEGIPYSLKDVFTTEGIRSTGASKILDTFIPPYSSTAYTKMKSAGGILIGKNNCDEFAQGGTNKNSAYGPAKNPVNPAYITGGSSGGSAAAVAAGSSIFSLGTDTGGSIRQPASFTGTVGLKVTYGRTSRFGVMAMASSFDTIGPFAKTVEDIAITLEHLAGQDPHDGTTHPAEVPAYSTLLEDKPTGLTFGLPKEYFGEDIDPRIAKLIEERAKELEQQGHTIKEVSMPSTVHALATYYIIVPAEVSANMSRYDGLRYGPTISNPENLDQLYLENRSKGFGWEVKRRILTGTYVLSAGYVDAYYKQAQRVRTMIIREFESVFKEVDALITPTVPSLPPQLDEELDPIVEYKADLLTLPASCAGVPALSLPVGEIDGLPVGMQIITPQLTEDLLLRIGHMIENA